MKEAVAPVARTTLRPTLKPSEKDSKPGERKNVPAVAFRPPYGAQRWSCARIIPSTRYPGPCA
jgi:hypothetical protein